MSKRTPGSTRKYKYSTVIAVIFAVLVVVVGVFLMTRLSRPNLGRNLVGNDTSTIGANELGSRLEESLAKSVYGGIWIDDNNKVQIGIVGDEDTIAKSRLIINQEAAVLGMGDIHITSVKNSWQKLQQTNEAIHQLHQKNIDYKNGAWPIQMGIKTDINKVQVDIPTEQHLTEAHRVVIREINDKYKDQVFFTTYDSLPVAQ